MDGSDELRMLADELRVIAAGGIRWTADDPYNRDRFERVQDAAMRLFAFTDTRPLDEVRRSVLTQLTHVAPAPCGDAAVFDDDGRILLIQRADDRRWAMPGGAFEMGETAAEGVRREAREETGVEVEIVDLVGVYDSRFCGTRASIQLYQFVFLCRPVAVGAPSTPHEVLDQGWFGEHELPPLSAGHTVRVPDAFRFLGDRRPFFDRPARLSPSRAGNDSPMADHDDPQPARVDDRPAAADVAPGDVEPVVEDGEELGQVSGGGEITDVAGDSPSS